MEAEEGVEVTVDATISQSLSIAVFKTGAFGTDKGYRIEVQGIHKVLGHVILHVRYGEYDSPMSR